MLCSDHFAGPQPCPWAALECSEELSEEASSKTARDSPRDDSAVAGTSIGDESGECSEVCKPRPEEDSAEHPILPVQEQPPPLLAARPNTTPPMFDIYDSDGVDVAVQTEASLSNTVMLHEPSQVLEAVTQLAIAAVIDSVQGKLANLQRWHLETARCLGDEPNRSSASGMSSPARIVEEVPWHLFRTADA